LVYAHPTLVLSFALLLTFITFFLVTKWNRARRPFIRQNPDDAERVVTWELAAMWYAIYFFVSIVSLVIKVGFVFFVPISFLGTFFAAITTLIEPSSFTEPHLANGGENEGEPDETSPLLRDEIDEHASSIDADEERLNGLLAPKLDDDSIYPDWHNWLWLLRFTLMVPLQTLIALEMVVWQVIPGLAQTITEGTPVLIVYIAIGLFAIICLTNTLPFLLRLPFKSTTVLIFPVFVAMIIAISEPPLNKFTPTAPFKSFYRSTYDLDTGNSTAYLYGMYPYVDKVLEHVPTPKAIGYQCEVYLAKAGRVCYYPIPNPVLPKPNDEWFTITSSIQPESDESSTLAKVQIHTDKTRVCYLEFDKFSPPVIAGIGGIRFYSDAEAKEGYTTLRLFKRTWESAPFEVLLKFEKGSSGNITVACGFDEWSPDGGIGFVPSLDEIWKNMPAWAIVTKLYTGLLQVRKGYTVF
jgi:hypothetical protein